jgi:2-amino-4-hydroxy-6-hydroxymethyldihydropteridine diphosphokinase
MARVYVGIGSNIEPAHYIRLALAQLQQHYGPLLISPIYESQAIGFEGANFYNLVVGFDTQDTVYQVNRSLHELEQQNGRQRATTALNNRTLDLDLLLYDDLILNEPTLKLPRPEITQYAFVLRPLAEIAPTTYHPTSQYCYAELWQAFDQTSQPLWPVELPSL